MTTEEAREAARLVTTHPEVPQATAREEAVEVMARALCAWNGLSWDEARRPSGPDNDTEAEAYASMAEDALDALVAATQEDGAPLVLLGPEPVYWQKTGRDSWWSILSPVEGIPEPLYRSQRETQ